MKHIFSAFYAILANDNKNFEEKLKYSIIQSVSVEKTFIVFTLWES